MQKRRSAKAADVEELKAVVNGLRRVVRAIRVSSHEAEASLGVTGAQQFVLRELLERPGASLRDLAALTLTDQSSVSVVVSRLVKRKLVSRKASSTDGRSVELSLTARGEQLLRDAPELAQARLVRSLRKVPAARLRTMRQVLDGVVRDLGLAATPAEMFFEEKPRSRK